jgi:hypothetical protein
MGIGEILRDGHLETFRNILRIRCTKIGTWARELNADADASAVARSDALHFGKQPCVEIRETSRHTSFVIAHKLSTIVESDEIVVLDHGTIVERGSHHVLMRNQSLYATLWAAQNGPRAVA